MDAMKELDKRQFAKAVKKQEPEKGPVIAYATATSNGTVIIDGYDVATPCKSTVEVHQGDRVRVSIENHKVVVTGNLTTPSINDDDYPHVKDIAESANEILDSMGEVADEADKTLAQIISDAVHSAEGLAEIETYVGYAEGYTQTLAARVEEVDQDAQQGIADIAEDVAAVEEAYQAADAAIAADVAAVDAAYQAADAAIAADVARVEEETAEALEDIAEDVQRASDAADEADRKATEAGLSANQAAASAAQANAHATDALTQLSFVEDVAGTLAWIQEHGTFTASTDTSVQPGTVYFTYNSTTHDYEPIVSPAADANPSTSGWYVLDITDSQTEFIMAHLAVTTRGLWVLPAGLPAQNQTVDNDVDKASNNDTSAQKQANANARKASKYKMLLSSDGVYVYDGSGHLVTTYGESITFDSSRSQYIGNEDAYILFTPERVVSGQTVPASITIGGGNINLGDSRTLSELIEQVDHPTFYITEEYSQDGSSVTVTAHVEIAGVDVTSSYPGSCFAWYKKSETDSAPLVPIQSATGYSVTLQRSTVGYGAAVVCKFTEPSDALALDGDDDTLTDSSNTPVSVRVPSGDYVRIADLEATATVFDADKMLLVTSEGEKLATVDTLKDVFGTASYEDLDDLPTIEGVTLMDDKSFTDLGIFRTDSQGYDVPDDYTLSTMDINALWANAQPIGG